MKIDRAKALDLLRSDIAQVEHAVKVAAGACTQGQFDALVCFAFNLGIGALMSSTLLKKHKAGDFRGATAEFGRWIHGGGRILKGLVRRRTAEATLYAS
jgi:lysozyme